MSKCSFVTRIVPDNPRASVSEGHAEAFCATHNMPPLPGEDGKIEPLCAIGKIEQAVEAGLQEIANALDPQRRAHNEMYGRNSNARAIPK